MMIKVNIYGHRRVLYDDEVTSVKLKTKQGVNIIAQDYVPIIAMLSDSKQVIEVHELDGQVKTLEVSGGLIKFNHNHLNIITKEE